MKCKVSLSLSPGTNPHFADITYKFQVEK
jgi:hypothetical protein